MASRDVGLGGLDDFPYDAALDPARLHGLDRLRAIPDRKLARYLYELHAQAERNEAEQRRTPAMAAPVAPDLRRVADRALLGELGAEVCELATYLLLDKAGRRRVDEASLRTFGRALRDLRRSQR